MRDNRWARGLTGVQRRDNRWAQVTKGIGTVGNRWALGVTSEYEGEKV
jgi:hypothetical protein